MNIQLKQSEIEKALAQYIANKGFSLTGKTITIEFTAGRKAGGLIADLVIDDTDIPGFTDSDEQEVKTKATLSVVDNSEKPALDTAAIAEAARNVVLEEDQAPVEAQAADTPAAVAEPEAPKPSLFS